MTDDETISLKQMEFEAYHAANPQIYDKLREFAFEAVNAGRTRIGINLLHERVRWYTAVEAHNDEWKLNNNWRPWYARLLKRNEPLLAPLFETRVAEADRRIAA